MNFITLRKYYHIKSENYYALELDKKALEVGRKAGVKNILPYYFDKTILSKITRFTPPQQTQLYPQPLKTSM